MRRIFAGELMDGGGWAFDHPGGVIADGDGDGAMAGCGFSRREAEDDLSWGVAAWDNLGLVKWGSYRGVGQIFGKRGLIWPWGRR